ncbi:uroporphyrinogen decarboxylase [Acidocella aminolytica]|uniref:Uroporphyrinogen decarboxylase n=3 Tax=Acidocella TaxID=50709 RepID=A0A0D6PEC8_9PROT|nr:uroporphyrinogen decarboxylase [Acidocella aminolytica]GAN79691.1 uroporphyrinogen decarboxylase [Acidocella aminolytica 101 = DSM 11237]SHF04520.1 uroporphyrinogen decarboxylase [Acidocella aminolytica 101 = DSM 11237]
MKFRDVLGKKEVWPPPIWLMRQAGRYLPEYRATRAKAGDFISLCLNPVLAEEVTLQPIHKFGFDAAILFSDILILPMALGQGLRFAEGEGPRMPPLEDIGTLKPEQAAGVYAPVMETVSRLRGSLPQETALIGFAGGPATVACYMLDGQGGGFPRTRRLAYEQPDFVRQVLKVLTEATIEYLSAQVKAGADCVMLFESWAGIFPPAQFREFVISPNRRICEILKERHKGLKIIGFPRLAGLMLGEYAREAGVDAVGLDSVTGLPEARAACTAGTVFQGNLDPLLLKLGGRAMDEAVKRMLDEVRGHPHILNLGHGITPDVPEAHVARLVELVRQSG